jgi:hypothetical protein
MQRVLSSLFLAGRRSYSYSDEPQYHTKYFVAAAYFYQVLHCAAGVGVCFWVFTCWKKKMEMLM